MKKILFLIVLLICALNIEAKTLIAYYSYTGNCKAIATELKSQITADILEIQPAEEGLDYAANNYALGSSLISAIKKNPNSESSYPAIKAITTDLIQYGTVIIVTPLWWSQMAAPMQTFLFKNATALANKNIGLIVSSYSSGISGVESDAKRLLPDGKFMSESLWINNANLSKKQSLIQTWLKTVDYATISSTETSSTMTITINNHDLIVDLVSNSSTEALLELLKEAPITYEAHDYGNFEKVGDIGHTLPQNNEEITTVPGDVILYLGRNICIYYDTNEWDFTRLGKIRDVTQSELKQILGDGNVTVKLSLGEISGVNLIKADNPKSKKMYSIDGKALNTLPANGVYIDNGIKKAAGHNVPKSK